MNCSFNVTYLKKINSEERGQANQLQAYLSGDLNVDGEKVTTFRSLRLYNSKYYNQQTVGTPKIKGPDGVYRDMYNIPSNIRKIISDAAIAAFKSQTLTSNE